MIRDRSERHVGARGVFLLLLGAVLLFQTAWILVVPPFRGLDEHDHAYKAAAVARGDWSPSHVPAREGWGELMKVPEDLVTAARPVCKALPYTERSNCYPVHRYDDGLVSVASSAARYNPAFYFVIGSAARPFRGALALYVMRFTAAFLCALLLALAGVTWWTQTTRGLPTAAFLVAITPTLLYSTAIAAPNGIEMASATLVWVSLLALLRQPSSPGTRRLIVMAAAGALPLATVRTLGPLWLALIVLTCLAATSVDAARALMKRSDARIAATLVTGAIGLSLAWSLGAGTNSPGSGQLFSDSPWPQIPENWALWIFQSIAAFPARDEIAPMGVYVVALLAAWVLLAVAGRVGTGRHRLVLGLIVLVSSAVPIVMTVSTYQQLGTAWQGRYGYPYSLGFFLICGLALERAPQLRRRGRWLLAGGAAVVVCTEQAVSQLHVLFGQKIHSPLAGTSEWHAPSTLLVVVLIGAASAMACAPIALTAPRRSTSAEAQRRPSEVLS